MALIVGPAESNSRKALSRELDCIRSSIKDGNLVLFIGEQVSILGTRNESACSVDDWWEIIGDGTEVKMLRLIFED